MPKAWNIFSIGRRSGDEDQLTEMLAWLASAMPSVLATIVELALGEQREVGETRVTTQFSIAGTGRLDALLEGPDHVIIVESKLGSDYGEDQLARYLTWFAKKPNPATTRALLTLTAREAPWPAEARDLATAHGIRPASRRWEELHRVLEPLAAVGPGDAAGRLVRDFLDMLADEGLVPTPPLTAEEMSGAWASAWAVVRRYREFFHTCKEDIGVALDAMPVANSYSDRGDWFWQDYKTEDGTRIVFGLFHTDENEPVSPKEGKPIVWAGVLADHRPDWPEHRQNLAAHSPQGWRRGNDWWGRTVVWRPLATLVTADDLDGQRRDLAAAAQDIAQWVET